MRVQLVRPEPFQPSRGLVRAEGPTGPDLSVTRIRQQGVSSTRGAVRQTFSPAASYTGDRSTVWGRKALTHLMIKGDDRVEVKVSRPVGSRLPATVSPVQRQAEPDI